MAPPPVKYEAHRAGLKILQPEKARETAFQKELRVLNPSVIVVVAYGQILSREVIHLPEYGCINIHASLLPKYRGPAPINWAIINGEDKTGVTTILMDEGMDTGPLLLQAEVKIEEDDTAETLSVRLSEIGAQVLMQTLKGLEEGRLKPKPQEGEPSYAPMLKKTDGLIQWSKDARQLYNFIRGMNPWPGAYSFLHGKRVKILKAALVAGDGDIGVISRVSKDKLLVGTGKGLISVIEIQAEGKPAMPIKAFLQGRKITEGMRFHEKPVA